MGRWGIRMCELGVVGMGHCWALFRDGGHF